MKILVSYCSGCTHSDNSDEMYGAWSAVYDFDITSVYRIDDDKDETSYNADAFLIADDSATAYVIVMRYSTGDSFGSSNGHGEIIHAFGNEEIANKALDSIREQEDNYTITFTDDLGRDISYSNPGAGYFESVDSIEIEKFPI